MTEEGSSADREMINFDTQNFLEQFGSKFELLSENGFNPRFDFILKKKSLKDLYVHFKKNCWAPIQ